MAFSKHEEQQLIEADDTANVRLGAATGSGSCSATKKRSSGIRSERSLLAMLPSRCISRPLEGFLARLENNRTPIPGSEAPPDEPSPQAKSRPKPSHG